MSVSLDCAKLWGCMWTTARDLSRMHISSVMSHGYMPGCGRTVALRAYTRQTSAPLPSFRTTVGGSLISLRASEPSPPGEG